MMMHGVGDAPGLELQGVSLKRDGRMALLPAARRAQHMLIVMRKPEEA